MKKIIFILCITASYSIQAQMLIPEFEAPEKVESLSSEAEESMPMPFNNGDNFYYFRTYIEGEGAKTRVKGQDIWFAEKKDGQWDDPYRLFRSDYLPGNNSIIGTSANGERVYLYQTTYEKEKKEIKEIRKIVYLDNKGKDKWTDPVEIKVPGLVFMEKNYDFYMNTKGTILMISMSPSESVLDEDLYVSIKQEDGSWGEIIDLGDVVNTTKFEVSPFLAEDDKTLYFSSNGHEGFGGADIFVTYRIGDDWTKWTKPLNLGEPLNSADYDAYFTMGNNLEIYFTSDRNDIHSNIFQSKATGKFKFANQQAVFNYANLPAEGVTLQVFDADGNLIDEVQTDAYGNFTFRKLDADENYIVKVAEGMDEGVVEEDFVGSKIYFVNSKGEKTNRFIYTADKGFVNAKDILATNEILGSFNYKELPMKNTALLVLDENGFPIDTIYTDAFGNFNYTMLEHDKNFSIVPLNLTDEDLNEINLSLLDKDGAVVQKGKVDGKGFKFEPMETKDVLVAETPSKDKFTNYQKESTYKNETKSSWSGKGEVKATVFFDFAVNEMNESSKAELKKVMDKLKGEKIILIGHTDNIGSEESNNKRGYERANSVKKYLEEMGVTVDSVELSSKGEVAPIAPNKYERGRAKNRRVEVIVQ